MSLSSGLSISWVLCALCFRFCVLVVSLPPVFIIAFALVTVVFDLVFEALYAALPLLAVALH